MKKHRFDAKRLKRRPILIEKLPQGLNEEQLQQYFSQYGKITHMRMARSLCTGKNKQFAYIEFHSPDIGKIAVNIFYKYVMYHRIGPANVPPHQDQQRYSNKSIAATEQRNAAAIKQQSRLMPFKQLGRSFRRKDEKLIKAGVIIDVWSQLPRPGHE